MPSLQDWFDVLTTFTFLNLLTSVFFASFCAVFVSTSGFKGSLQYYHSVITICGHIFNQLAFGAILPLYFLFLWHQFNVATCP